MIAAKIANALALDYPRELLEVIVACDGCTRRDRAAPRAMREPTSCSSCRAAARSARRTPRSSAPRGEIVAFSDANAPVGGRRGERARRRRSRIPRVGYACGQVRFVQAASGPGRNQEGLYWRYEMAVRAARVAARLDHRRQRRDLRDAPGQLHRRRPGHGPRPLAAVQHRQAGHARRLRPGRAGNREDGALDRAASSRASGG